VGDREPEQVPVGAAERRPPNEALAAAPTTEGAPSSSPPSLVLVTGASGFLGSALAAQLRSRGHDVQTLVRPSSPRANLDPRDTVREGDLRDPPSLAAALKGVRFLFHAAADYRLWARNPE
jgi:dihydroflavonol-4-reductase